jgi:hypothetical protein
MPTTSIFIRVTHTGKYADGRTNTAPVLIPDLDVGYENQNRKVPCYVPVGGHIDIPASSRALLSYDQGYIKKFAAAGLVTAELHQQPALQPAYYIDATNGNDTNNGATAATALKTNAELASRINGQPITSSITVTYVNLPPESDPLRLDVQLQQTAFTNVALILQGPALVTKKSGTLTVTGTRNRATNTAWAVTGSVAFDATDVGLRMRIPSGARAGARTSMLKNTAGTIRTSGWGIPDPQGLYGSGFGINTFVTPQNGDPYVVETSPGILYVDYINVRGNAPGQYTTGTTAVSGPSVQFLDLDLAPTQGNTNNVIVRRDNCILLFHNCRFLKEQHGNFRAWLFAFRVIDTLYTYVMNCIAPDPTFTAVTATGEGIGYEFPIGCTFDNFGALCTVGSSNGGTTVMTGESVVQGTFMGAFEGGILQIEDCAVFDWAANGAAKGGLRVNLHSKAVLATYIYGATALWGSSAGANTVGVHIYDTSEMRYDNASHITIAGADATNGAGFLLAGQTAGFPFDRTTNAYLAAVTGTWANLAGAGSKDNLHDPPGNAHIYKTLIQ